MFYKRLFVRLYASSDIFSFYRHNTLVNYHRHSRGREGQKPVFGVTYFFNDPFRVLKHKRKKENSIRYFTMVDENLRAKKQIRIEDFG